MSIDRDALIEAAARKLHRDWCDEADALGHSYGVRDWAKAAPLVDAILPAVEQAIRAAEQRGREQAAQAITGRANEEEHGLTAYWFHEAARLARGGSTDEEQTP